MLLASPGRQLSDPVGALRRPDLATLRVRAPLIRAAVRLPGAGRLDVDEIRTAMSTHKIHAPQSIAALHAPHTRQKGSYDA